LSARPAQAALASAASFAAGAIVPVLATLLFGGERLIGAMIVITLMLLAATGAIGARVGGANIARGAARVVFWGAMAMAATFAIGRLFGTQF